MDKRLIPLAVTAALCLASCSNDEVMERNPNPRGNAITFSAKVGRSTRATETKPDNLGNFYVFAKSVHPDKTLYDAFLIGSDGNTPEIAERDKAESGSWTYEWALDRDVYLPNGISNVVFWAFTDQQTPATGEMGTDILSSGTVGFHNITGPKIENYESAKADLTDTEKTTWADGSVQRDLVSAFADAKKEGGSGLNNHITLDFKHMLSEISIRGAQNNLSPNDHRRVFVKGVWIVNAQRKATLSAGYDKDNTKDNPNWEFSSKTLTQFGTYFSSPVELWKKKGGESDGDWADLTSSSLMLIPQELTKWTPLQSDEFTTCEGAYIMILCRVELEHDGDKHEGGDQNDPNISVKGNKHYHQQFPATSIYDSDQYGFACLPIGIEFEKGKRYRFNLNICGKGAGAGIYPPGYTGEDGNPIPEIMALIPESEKNKIEIITIPTGGTDPKKPGDEVLDEAIKFTVNVLDWVGDDKGQWIDGNENF